jgi:hypothetical protein
VAVGVAVAVGVVVGVAVAVGVGVGVDCAHAGRLASTLNNEPNPGLYPPTIIGICPPATLSVAASAYDRPMFSVGPLDQLFVTGS